jgi:hypothetical protein
MRILDRPVNSWFDRHTRRLGFGELVIDPSPLLMILDTMSDERSGHVPPIVPTCRSRRLGIPVSRRLTVNVIVEITMVIDADRVPRIFLNLWRPMSRARTRKEVWGERLIPA